MCNNAWSVLQSGHAHLTCVAHRALRWVWTFNGGQLPDNASPTLTSNISSITNLDIKYLVQENTGSYRCEGYDEHDLVQAQTCGLNVRNGKFVCSNAKINFIKKIIAIFILVV